MRIISLLLVFLCTTSLWSAEDFPLRKKYPDVKTISGEEVIKNYNKAVIIDARSSFEYNVIHINKAINIPVADKEHFIPNLFKTMKGRMDKMIIFYCNGVTCGKSYKAASHAMDFGLNNVYAYDAGIFHFAETQPSKVTLMGHSPINIHNLIPKNIYNKHSLGAHDFQKHCEKKEAILFDGRDLIQKEGETPSWIAQKSLPAPFRGLVKVIMDKTYQRSIKDRPLCFVDKAGKQVRWLQYYLEQMGYKHYYFLNKGIYGIYH